MFNNGYYHFHHKVYIFIIIIIILAGLTINKFQQQQDEVIPVWSSYDEHYYSEKIKNVRNLFDPNKIILQLTKIKPDSPITYLKREIPLLAYYTPEVLKSPTQTIYQPESTSNSTQNKVIKLQFDLRQPKEKIKNSNRKIPQPQQPERPEYHFETQLLIAIYHTHTSETYIDDPRHQDNNGHVLPGNVGNVGKVGVEMAKTLSEKYNFKVIHTTKVHDWSYARSYYNSRKTVKELINKYPDLNMLLDIHRDSLIDASKEAITTMVNGERAARVMIIVTNGKFDFAHLNLEDYHSGWQHNLDFARKMAAKMEEMYPGLLKRIEIRDTTYNQDLHPRALLLEIGDYANTTQEALRAARLMADVIAALVYSEQ